MNIDPFKILANAVNPVPKIVPPTLAEIKKGAEYFGMDTCNDPKVESIIGSALTWGRMVRDGHPPCWLALLGNRGVGKTKIANKLWKTQVDNGRARPNAWGSSSGETVSPRYEYIPQFIYWPDFVKDLRDPEKSALRISSDMKYWPFLFLDDVGAERDPTGFAADNLNSILGTRSGKWTVITSNKFLHQLADMDIRIADRMQRDGSIVIETTATSFTER